MILRKMVLVAFRMFFEKMANCIRCQRTLSKQIVRKIIKQKIIVSVWKIKKYPPLERNKKPHFSERNYFYLKNAIGVCLHIRRKSYLKGFFYDSKELT